MHEILENVSTKKEHIVECFLIYKSCLIKDIIARISII